MRKLKFFAAALLVAMASASCYESDNPTIVEEPKTIIELDGQQYETDVIATLKATPGEEVSLTLGVYDAFDIYGVDFGDGNIVTDTVCFQNGGLRGADGLTVEWRKSATKFTGTVAGDGFITVYGNSDLWYLNTSGGASPVSFDEPKLSKVVQVSITGADVAIVALPQLDSLKQFTFNNSPVKSVDVSKAPALTSLTINSNTASKYEPQLQSIDVSKNTELTYLSLQGPTKDGIGKLTTIDLTNNTKLESVYLQYNQLTSVKLGAEYPKLGMLNIQDNQLTEFDFTKLPYIKDIYAQNNKLTKVDLSKMTRTGGNVYFQNNQLTELAVPVSVKYLYANDNQLTSISIADATTGAYMQNNKLTLATLPAKPAGLNTAAKIKRFVYAPQAALEVAAEVTDLDLSAQLTAVGVETEAKTTVYSFVTASGTTLKEGTDYKVTAPGKFQFVKAQSEKVHGVMANEALPLFTGDNAFVTTEFTVKAAAAAKSWDFTVWSSETVANLKADAAASKVSGWSDVEKKADAEAGADPTEISKDKCFWATFSEGGELKANGVAIKELAGLQFNADYLAARSLAIAVDYPTTSLGSYAGGAYLWLGGSKKACFTIPAVAAGAKITIEAESHKPTDARGVALYAGSVADENKIGDSFTPTTKATYTWTVDKATDVVVYNTNGCHIYKLTVE